jgi:hypothetical protein
MILIIGVVLGLGYYFFIKPNMEKMDQTEIEIAAVNLKIAEAESAVAEEAQVRAQYEEAKKKPPEAQKVFFPEMDTVDAERTITKILEDKGYKAIDGIAVSSMQPVTLTVAAPQEESNITYEIQNYSFLQGVAQADGAADSSGGEAITIESAQQYLNEEHTKDEKAKMVNVIRSMLLGQTAEIAVIKGGFSLELDNREYKAFLNYLNSLTQATAVTRCEFRNANRDTAEKQIYDFSLNLYVVREMEMVEDLF